MSQVESVAPRGLRMRRKVKLHLYSLGRQGLLVQQERISQQTSSTVTASSDVSGKTNNSLWSVLSLVLLTLWNMSWWIGRHFCGFVYGRTNDCPQANTRC